MTLIKLYYDLLSQPSRALYIFMKSAKIPFEPHPVALRKGEHLSEEFKEKCSQFQTVPFIHHKDNFRLNESVAIFRYLTREYDISDHWYPINSYAKAKVDEYLEWQHNNTRRCCAEYFRIKWLLPLTVRDKPVAVSPDRIAALESDVNTCMDNIERLWLSKNRFINGDRISIADLFAACEIEQPRIAGFDATDGRLILANWLKNVRKQTNPYYDEAHSILNKIATASSNKANKNKTKAKNNNNDDDNNNKAVEKSS